jgi:hypothetical protein
VTSRNDFKELIMITSRHVIPATAFAMALVLMTACPGSADEPRPAIDGNISIDGKPMARGRIIFYLDDDQFVGVKVKDGAFKIARVPEGTWRVGIEGEGVPAKHASEETTGLTVQVRAGKNTFDFSLRGQ